MTDPLTAQALLYTSVASTARMRFAQPLPPEVQARLHEQQRIISEASFETYLDLLGDILPAEQSAATCDTCTGRTRDGIQLRIAGKPFRCDCGANVFSGRHDPLRGCLYLCRGCGATYQGEPE